MTHAMPGMLFSYEGGFFCVLCVLCVLCVENIDYPAGLSIVYDGNYVTGDWFNIAYVGISLNRDVTVILP